uniref:Uncharacterized protein n=1 Tax=Sarcoptes scabiei TaxID=52283 RepID=A0A834VEP1_SARSC
MVLAQESTEGSGERNVGFVTTEEKSVLKCWKCSRPDHELGDIKVRCDLCMPDQNFLRESC